MACLLDMFASDRPIAEIRSAARALRTSVPLMKRDLKVTSLFRPASFRLLLTTATNIAIDRGFIPARDR